MTVSPDYKDQLLCLCQRILFVLAMVFCSANAANATIWEAEKNYIQTVPEATINSVDQLSVVQSSIAAPQTVVYEDRGNMTQLGNRNFFYNSLNQLTTATNTGVTVTYSYDPEGRKVWTDENGVKTGHIYAGDMVIADTDHTGNIIRRYVPGRGVDDRIVMINVRPNPNYRSGYNGYFGPLTHPSIEISRAYYARDHDGSVVAMLSSSGKIMDRYVYTPYGVKHIASTNSSGNPYRYTGRRYEASLDIYDYRARHYEANIGRFLQTDPIGFADQMNLYAYVHNDPMNMIDPDGQAAIDCVGSVTPDGAAVMCVRSGENDAPDTLSVGLHIVATGAHTYPISNQPVANMAAANQAVKSLLEEMQPGALVTVTGNDETGEGKFQTAGEADKQAERLGYRPTGKTTKGGQQIYKKSGRQDFITRDIDGHKGGAWKRASSVSKFKTNLRV